MITLNERLSEVIEKLFALVSDEIREDLIEYTQSQTERATSIHESLEKYKQYLLTLDPDMLLNIVDLYEDLGGSGGSIFVSHPVNLDTINDIALTHRAYNMLYGPPSRCNTYPLFVIPKGKYRLVLMAIPVGEDES